jgi:uncharacterized paraquat-inducible protein A
MNGKNQRTRWIEESIDYDGLVWVCEQCDFTTQFDCDGPEEHEYNFCPRCGRKITEYIKYIDPFDEWVEGEE